MLEGNWNLQQVLCLNKKKKPALAGGENWLEERTNPAVSPESDVSVNSL